MEVSSGLNRVYRIQRETPIAMSSPRLKSAVSGKSSAPLSRTEEAYDRIRLEILTFGLLPGELVSEVALAERLELSLAAVRAVLPRLRHDGLLINKKRRGQMVSPVTLEDIENTYELRYLLEPRAAEQAVGNIDKGVLKKLNERASPATLPSDRQTKLDAMFAHREFHLAIAAACTNKQLAQWICHLNDKVLRFQYLDLRSSEARGFGWRNNHADIVAAFDKGDPKKAAEAMREDVSGGRELVLQAIMDLPEFRKLNLTGSNLGQATG
jgi:DNA-binding GntR family transcriptional regulator